MLFNSCMYFAWLIFLIGHDFIRLNFARVKRSLARSPCLLPQEPVDSSVSLSFLSGSATQRAHPSHPSPPGSATQRAHPSHPPLPGSATQRAHPSHPSLPGSATQRAHPSNSVKGNSRYAPCPELAELSLPISLTAHKRKGPVSSPFPRGTRQGKNFNGIISLAFIPSTGRDLFLL